jgi:hypothetical protein
MSLPEKSSALKGARLHKVIGEEVSKLMMANCSKKDYAAIADTPLRWLLLGLDTITADFAPPPPDLATESSGLPPAPAPPKPVANSKKQKKGNDRAAKVQKKLDPAPPPAIEDPLPGAGTPENTALRLLTCLRKVVRKEQRARQQTMLHLLIKHVRGIELSGPNQQGSVLQEALLQQARPRTPEIVRDLSAASQFWQPMHSQVWRSGERPRKQAQNKVSRSVSTSSVFSHIEPAPSGKGASKGSVSPAQGSLPPVKKVVKKYERGAPALGAGFKVLHGFRATGTSFFNREAVSDAAKTGSTAKVLTLEGTVDLLKDVGIWSDLPSSEPAQTQQLSMSLSAGTLPPLREPAPTLRGVKLRCQANAPWSLRNLPQSLVSCQAKPH